MKVLVALTQKSGTSLKHDCSGEKNCFFNLAMFLKSKLGVENCFGDGAEFKESFVCQTFPDRPEKSRKLMVRIERVANYVQRGIR